MRALGSPIVACAPHRVNSRLLQVPGSSYTPLFPRPPPRLLAKRSGHLLHGRRNRRGSAPHGGRFGVVPARGTRTSAHVHSEVLHLESTLLDPDQHDQVPGPLELFGTVSLSHGHHRDVHDARHRSRHAHGVDLRQRRTLDHAVPVQPWPVRMQPQLTILAMRRAPQRQRPRAHDEVIVVRHQAPGENLQAVLALGRLERADEPLS